jgi:hypothetical protein
MSLERPNRRFARTLVLIALTAMPSAVASAAPAEKPAETPPTWEETVALSTAEGAFLPLTLLPSVGPARAQGSVMGGYDSARSSPRMESYAEARIFGPIALRLGASLRDEGPENALAPSLGARVQVLRRDRAGIDGAVALTYKAEGFTEPEGELEAVLAVGTRIGRFLILGNLAYGQDGEGNERDGELRAATLYQAMSRLQLGLDARGRFDLGSNHDTLKAKNEPLYDLDVGPVLTATLGPVALNLHGGASVIRRVDEQTAVGAIVLGGVGTSF